MKLIKITSDNVQIRTDSEEFRDIRINDLVSVSDGETELVTVVVSVSDIDAGGALGEEDYIFEGVSMKNVECSIVGSVRDGIFTKAVGRYPTMDVTAEIISGERFRKMLSSYESGFLIGEYAAYGCPAFVDGDKFFQRHACIVGNTGSGKSETVARILEQASKLPGTNIIVFDIHGEYSGLSYVRNIRIGDDDDKIRLNQRKPSKYKGLSRFGPEKNLQRINKFMKERPIFYKNLIQMKENFRFYLRCFYCITKVVILQFNSENRTELARNG